MIRIVILALIVIGGCTSSVVETPRQGPLVVDYEASETFDRGELNGWASYPPAQDTAYDTSLFAVNGSLRRTLKAVNDSRILEAGVIRRWSFLANSASELTFDALVEPAGPDVRVTLCHADGRREEQSHPAGTVRVRFDRDSEIEAVIIASGWRNVTTGTTHRISVDNIRLRARRPASFEIQDARYLEHFGRWISTRRGQPDEAFPISVSAPFELDRVLANGTPLTRADSRRWSGSVKLPAGVATVALEGTRGPDSMRSQLEVLVARRPAKRAGLFRLSSVEDPLIKRARGAAETWARKQLQNSPVDRITPVSNLPTDILIETPEAKKSFWDWWVVLQTARERVGAGAYLYMLGDRAGGEAAVEALMRVCAVADRWLHPWFPAHGMTTYYPMGETLFELAFGYDAVYDLMTEEQRATVRRCLIEYGIRPAYHELVETNRIPFHQSNWIAVNLSGQLLAAAAVDGEEDVTPEILGLLAKIRAFVEWGFQADGSYGEGIGYANFATHYLGRLLPVAKQQWNVEIPLPAYYLYDVYVRTPDGTLLDYGDSADKESPEREGLRWLARKEGQAWDLYRARLERDLAGSESNRFDTLLWPEQVGLDRPALPLTRHFKDKGTVACRSGWDEQAAVMTYQCGPAFNHNHTDTGTFLLFAQGELMIGEGGKAHYYDNPQYLPYYIKPPAHNVMTIDGDPECMRLPDFASPVKALRIHPAIVSVETKGGITRIDSRLESVYYGLKRYSRKLVFYPGALIVVDSASDDRPHRWEWTFHIVRESEKLAPGDFIARGKSGSLRFQISEGDAERIESPRRFGTLRVGAPASPSVVRAFVFQWDRNDPAPAKIAVGKNRIDVHAAGREVRIELDR